MPSPGFATLSRMRERGYALTRLRRPLQRDPHPDPPPDRGKEMQGEVNALTRVVPPRTGSAEIAPSSGDPPRVRDLVRGYRAHRVGGNRNHSQRLARRGREFDVVACAIAMDHYYGSDVTRLERRVG